MEAEVEARAEAERLRQLAEGLQASAKQATDAEEAVRLVCQEWGEARRDEKPRSPLGESLM